MRANLIIDDRLMARAMRASGAATRREAIERGLELLLALGGQASIRRGHGESRWTTDSDERVREQPR